MRTSRILATIAAGGLAAAALVVAAAPGASRAADHLDGPSLLTSPSGNLRADINDVYVFRAADPSKTVLAVTTHPAAGFISPLDYASNVTYVIDIDRDGDAVEDVAYAVRFAAPAGDGSQSYTVTRYTGGNARSLSQGVELGGGMRGASATLKGGTQVFAGLRSDPFFFDLGAFLAQVAGVQGNLIPGVLDTTGRSFCDANTNDFFSALNTNAIVLEVGSDLLTQDGSGTVGVWARTIGPSGQIDRMGRPAINTVFNHGADKTTFNREAPTQDRANFAASFRATLESFGYDAATASAITNVLLPDVITYRVGSAANGAALNGRALADDVIDAELGIVTNGHITSDCVGPHTDYAATFPYLGAPHQ
ncbi:MAG TPA: DUF4331 family protein [Candidatus Dormibacteraeota bacterium]|jgi:hypothetical protein|nr:DUF4331 family protein [Candidatus Dormibacteraeota bacterium]